MKKKTNKKLKSELTEQEIKELGLLSEEEFLKQYEKHKQEKEKLLNEYYNAQFEYNAHKYGKSALIIAFYFARLSCLIGCFFSLLGIIITILFSFAFGYPHWSLFSIYYFIVFGLCYLCYYFVDKYLREHERETYNKMRQIRKKIITHY